MSSLEIRVCGRYRLEDKLYEGKASTIYSGRNVQSDTDCSIKCESKTVKPSMVGNEGRVLEEIQGGIGIPNLLWAGENGDFNFLITELLGNSLEDYL
jgi:serine/threonine protein kinase